MITRENVPTFFTLVNSQLQRGEKFKLTSSDYIPSHRTCRLYIHIGVYNISAGGVNIFQYSNVYSGYAHHKTSGARNKQLVAPSR